MKKSITKKYPAKAESILSSCFVIKRNYSAPLWKTFR